jgi:glycine/D-amino acid oxidase-like deaminating enzyme
VSGRSAEILILGAGMAGVSVAFHLAVRRGLAGVVLVDEREPLTLTSDKGTEGYRNWFPGPGDAMVRFMNRSIDLIERLSEESGEAFALNRRGYVMLTRDPSRLEAMARAAAEISALGAGALRRHPGSEPYVPAPARGFRGQPTGADRVDDPALIRQLYPGLDPDIAGMLHVRRAGFFDALGAGRWMLERAIAAGVRVVRDRVDAVETRGGRIAGVTLASGARIDTGGLVIAAGPLLARAAAMLGLTLPVFCELHAKLAIQDTEGVVSRDAPMLIWNDPVELEWSAAERRALAADPAAARLLGPLPAGVHVRPRNRGREILLIWTFDDAPRAPEWPPRYDPHYGEALIRAAAHMIPGLRAYFGRAAEGTVDGGYYCKTPENRPLIGPLAVEGAWVCAALSGFGIMGAHAAADLLATHIEGGALPEDAAAFLPARHDDPAYAATMRAHGGWSGQL